MLADHIVDKTSDAVCAATSYLIAGALDVLMAKRNASPSRIRRETKESNSLVHVAITALRSTLIVSLTRLAAVEAATLASIAHSASRGGLDVAIHLQGDVISDGSFEHSMPLNN